MSAIFSCGSQSPTKAALYPSLPALQSGSRLLRLLSLHGPVAQSGERRPRMAEVTSSSLVGSTPKTYRFAAQNYSAQRSLGRDPGLLTATVLQPRIEFVHVPNKPPQVTRQYAPARISIHCHNIL